MSVYIDTSAILAICNADDERHSDAVEAWIRIIDNEEVVSTTNYVVVETIAVLQHRHGIPAVRRFVEDVLPAVLIEWVDPAIHTAAVAAVIASQSRQSPGIVDSVSFEIIRKSQIEHVFCYDKHFANAGFTIIGE
jgi:uncharacterized protein